MFEGFFLYMFFYSSALEWHFTSNIKITITLLKQMFGIVARGEMTHLQLYKTMNPSKKTSKLWLR